MNKVSFPTLRLCLTGALLVALTACNSQANTAGKAEPEQVRKTNQSPAENLPAISVVTAKKQEVVDEVLVSGLIEPVEQVFVQPQIEGQPIQSLAVDVGDSVKAGQVLATLSDESLGLQKDQLIASRESAKAGIAQAQAQIVESRASQREAIKARKRSVSLAKRGVVSQASLDTARAQASAASARLNAARQSLKSAQAQLAGVEAQVANIDYQLARTAVKAPVDGVVSARNARVGAIATAAANPMFELISNGALELRADVAEQDLLRLAIGQPATVNLPGSRTPVPGTVRLVEPAVHRDTRLGRARIAIENASGARAGMFAQAVVQLRRAQVVVLPVSAISVDSDGESALRVLNDTVKRVKIKTGARDNQFVEIVDGVTPGDVVIERAGAFVRDGDRIRPMQRPQSTASTDSSNG